MIKIGTSNWAQASIRASLGKERLPPGGMLRAYAQVFDTVEINSTFYRFHQTKTFAGWTERVPSGFTFAIKANRLFTHDRALRGSFAELDSFLSSLSSLGPYLGPVLFQLPASFTVDLEVLKRFVGHLRKQAPDVAFTFELRHPSWHCKEAWRVLEKAGAGFCIFDLRQFTAPLIVTSDLVYVRLHGPLKQPYRGRYGGEALAIWAERLRGWHRQKLHCHVYFDNTQFDDAVPDALDLRKLLAGAGGKNVGASR